MMKALSILVTGAAALQLAACAAAPHGEPRSPDGLRYLSQPLVTEIYTADPSARVFDDRLYIYGSHDIDGSTVEDDLGSHFEMRDYRVLSMDRVGGPVTVHPVALDVDQVPWARRQMWAPDAARKNGRYYLYFPAKDHQDVFRIGVAVSDRPEGPFTPRPEAIRGSYSIDPGMFTDDDGATYMYFGGIWGGQLQRWTGGRYDPAAGNTDLGRPDAPAIMPRIARMRDDMLEFAEAPREVTILDEQGRPILGGDLDRRFFEAAWVHKYQGRYYLSYSTGDTHYIVYATGDSPYGPFTYRGRVLLPVQGWTNHHSIAEFRGRWYLFYHDTQLSNRTHLRNIKMTELRHNPDGTIQTIDPFVR
ncbi:MAG: glycoside hydrolase family 43 protein [Allosphingosinicella sp.]|uniref:glycoside hydrolase family 43 protein n=1 Tax=Allosphingosinicella sp. TaxID=2823234 RepID=UPI003936321F